MVRPAYEVIWCHQCRTGRRKTDRATGDKMQTRCKIEACRQAHLGVVHEQDNRSKTALQLLFIVPVVIFCSPQSEFYTAYRITIGLDVVLLANQLPLRATSARAITSQTPTERFNTRFSRETS